MSQTYHPRNAESRAYRRGGVVVIKVAIFSVVLIGFAALAIDVGVIYNARLELRRAVDNSALAGAAMLTKTSVDPNAPPGVDPRNFDAAKQSAIDCALRNTVTGDPQHIADDDIEFGWAEPDPATAAYNFDPTASDVNAVRVTGRRTDENEVNGAVRLFFASIFGITESQMVMSATALMRPRDIAIVADLSASHNNDSELRSINELEINLGAVWAELPGGVDDDPGNWPGWDSTNPLAQGYAWGFFRRNPAGQSFGRGFGYDVDSESGPTTHIDKNSYNPNSDNGLVHFEFTAAPQDWLPTGGTAYGEIHDYLVNTSGYKLGDLRITDGAFEEPQPGDEPSEIYAIMGDHATNNTMRLRNWMARTAVATGFVEWYSGIPGGRWETAGMAAPMGPPNGDNLVDLHELVPSNSSLGGRSWFEMLFLWWDYTTEYVASDGTAMMTDGHPDFQWKIGPKTFANYLMEERPRHQDTPELAHTPHQPVHSEKQAVRALAEALEVDYRDLLSLDVYATSVSHEVDLTVDVIEVPLRLEEMQAVHYDGYTNIGGGIRQGRNTLTGPDARPNATKIIVLLSDGRSTAYEELTDYGPAGTPTGPPTPANTTEKLLIARQYAIDQAQWAGQEGIQIYAVSLGTSADVGLMDDIARETSGRHYHVEGASIEDYAAELIRVFEEIAVIRPVTLVQ